MRLVHGTHRVLEDAADAILRKDLSTITRPADKSDILTPWKERDRRSREVYVPQGVPDAASRSGTFHRETNPKYPHLNSATPGSRSTHRSARRGDLTPRDPSRGF